MFYTERKSESIYDDFFNKCYICECELEKDVDLEHRIPRAANKGDKKLLEKWNLFPACGYCNDRKGDGYFEVSSECKCGNGYLGIIDCTNCDPNKYIQLKIDNDENITITEKEHAPCVNYTILLLTTVYCGKRKEKMKNWKLSQLRSNVIEQYYICIVRSKQLKDKIKLDASKYDIDKLKDELIKHISPESPFSAFKRSYIEEMYNAAENLAVKSVFEEILNASRCICPETNSPDTHCSRKIAI